MNTSKVHVVARRKATILADYKFYSSATIDDSYEFVDCSDTNVFKVAKDVRAGVIPISHPYAVITLGNTGIINQYSHISASAMAMMNALIERYGCVNMKIWILGVLPRPNADEELIHYIKLQNKALYRAVRGVVRKKQYPVQFIPAYKWLLKRVKHPEEQMCVTKVNLSYFEKDSDILNANGLAHLHLLLAREIGLRRIKYEWKGMPMVVAKKGKRQVRKEAPVGEGSHGTGKGGGRGGERKSSVKRFQERKRFSEDPKFWSDVKVTMGSEDSEEPPTLVPI